MATGSKLKRWRQPDGSTVEAASEQAARDWWIDQQVKRRPKRGEVHEIGEAVVHLTDWLRQAFGLEEGDVRVWQCEHGEVIACPRAWITQRLVYCDVSHVFQSGAASGHKWSGQHTRHGASYASQAAEWMRQHEEATDAAGRR
jgi:hypothetical protein